MPLLSAYIRDQRLEKVASYIEGNVLDLGCGPALIMERHNAKIQNYVGVERRKEIVESLSKKYPKAKFYDLNLDHDKFYFDIKFNTILMTALIEHIFNQKHIFSEAVKYLKPNGVIAITTPTPFGNDIVHRIGALLGLFAKSAVDDHIVIYNKKRFEILANEMGLRLEKYSQFEFFCNQFALLRKDA